MRSCSRWTRRQWLSSVPPAAGGLAIGRSAFAANAPASRVAVARCTSYGTELLPTMQKMFDGLGGLGRIVAGKTVAIKVNLTGSPDYRLGYLPAESAHW